MSEKLKSGSRVGIDAQTISVSGYRNLQGTLAKKGIELVNTPDLFDAIWGNRPQIPPDKIFELEAVFAGISRIEKQNQATSKLNQYHADFLVVSMLDELAWLNNLRGSDISYNPVFMGFGLVGKNENYLFVNQSKIPVDLLKVLEKDGICIKEYESFYSFLSTLKNKRILLDPATANYSVYNYLSENNEIIEATSPVTCLKAIKNETELYG